MMTDETKLYAVEQSHTRVYCLSILYMHKEYLLFVCVCVYCIILYSV